MGGDAKRAPCSNFPSAGLVHGLRLLSQVSRCLVTLTAVAQGTSRVPGQPRCPRGAEALLSSCRCRQGDARLSPSHVQVPEALHGGGGRPRAVEQRLSEMGGGGRGAWGEADGLRDQTGAFPEPGLLPGCDEEALQLAQVSGEAEHA